MSAIEKDSVSEQLRSMVTRMSYLRQAPEDLSTIRCPNSHFLPDLSGAKLPHAGPFSPAAKFHNCMSDMFKWLATADDPDLDPTSITNPDRKMLPDDCDIQFTHADLNPVNIMVSKDSPCHVLAILDWEQSGWYPAYWEFCKAELTIEPHSEWQAVYWPKILGVPGCVISFYSYVSSFAS
ncbi:phosphotransferase family [Fusarium denticulatum]|uniref:Phosphotransferase family n=1 Tax=Fusarium denticulatum TaxID=48507 RepID=A0A8H5WX45_9HYPO|nr:phosphotransferase family [Fusarium denticulatum]